MTKKTMRLRRGMMMRQGTMMTSLPQSVSPPPAELRIQGFEPKVTYEPMRADSEALHSGEQDVTHDPTDADWEAWLEYDAGSPQYRDQRPDFVVRPNYPSPTPERRPRALQLLETLRLLCHGETRVTVELIAKSMRDQIDEDRLAGRKTSRWLVSWDVGKACFIVLWDAAVRIMRSLPGRPAGD